MKKGHLVQLISLFFVMVGLVLWLSLVWRDNTKLNAINHLKDLKSYNPDTLRLYRGENDSILCLFPIPRYSVASGPPAILFKDSGEVIARTPELGENAQLDAQFYEVRDFGERIVFSFQEDRWTEVSSDKSDGSGHFDE